MALPNTVVNPTYYARMTQAFLRSQLVGAAVANTRFEANITPGQVIDFPYAATVKVEDYTFSTDATIDDAVFTSDTLTVDQVKIATQNYDPLQNLQMHDPNWMDAHSEEMAYQLARNIDQYCLTTFLGDAAGTVTGGTLTSSTIFAKLNDVMSTLTRQRAGNGVPFAILDAERISLLAQVDVGNGFNRADAALMNGWVGNTSAGFQVYVSNDLPTAVTLTVDTQPTAGDTFTVLGHTWTCVADASTANAGEVNIGADVADFKTIFVKVIDGTSSTDYTDISTDGRREYSNAQIDAAAFDGNDCAITAYGKIGGTETFTEATNVFGTETSELLFGMTGAPSLVVQSEPEIIETQEPANKSKNILGTTMYGADVFHRDQQRLVKMTINL